MDADNVLYDKIYDLNGTEYSVPMYGVDLDDRTLDPDLSNRFRNDYFNQNIRLGYRKVTKAMNLETGLALVPSMTRSINLINDAKSIPTRWVWNYAPFMRLRYRFDKQESLNVNYRGNSSQPSMSQLQPVADETDPLRIVQGNPNLLPSFNHNLEVRYQNFNQERQQSVIRLVVAFETLEGATCHLDADRGEGAEAAADEFSHICAEFGCLGLAEA